MNKRIRFFIPCAQFESFILLERKPKRETMEIQEKRDAFVFLEVLWQMETTKYSSYYFNCKIGEAFYTLLPDVYFYSFCYTEKLFKVKVWIRPIRYPG